MECYHYSRGVCAWYKVIKTVKGHQYAYWQRSQRVGNRVRTQSIYVGPVKGGWGALPKQDADGNQARKRQATVAITAPMIEGEAGFIDAMFDRANRIDRFVVPFRDRPRRNGRQWVPDPRLFALPGLMNKTAVTVPMRLKSDDELLENIDDGPWFSPSLDRIQIPDQGRFVVTPGGGSPEEAFESVFLHECGHATATIPGCERDLSRAWYGGPIYAQEEVVAELTSQLVMRRLGKLSKVSPASVTYLLGWLSATFDEADARTYAEHEARKAADYLCGLYFSVITTDRREV